MIILRLCLFYLLSNSVVNCFLLLLIVVQLLAAKCKSIHLQGEQICCIGFSYQLTYLLSLAKVIQYYSVTIIAGQSGAVVSNVGLLLPPFPLFGRGLSVWSFFFCARSSCVCMKKIDFHPISSCRYSSPPINGKKWMDGTISLIIN